MIRTGIVLVCTSFLLGAVFCHWLVDYGVLWQKENLAEALKLSSAYYDDLLKSPIWFWWTLLGLDILAILTLLTKFVTGGTSSYLFDGGCLVLYVATTSVYFTDVRAALDALLVSGASHEDALKDLASSHTVIAVALTGVLFLQGGQAVAERADAKSASDPLPVGPETPTPTDPDAKISTTVTDVPIEPKSPERTSTRRRRKA